MPKRAARAARFSASDCALVGGRFCVKAGLAASSSTGAAASVVLASSTAASSVVLVGASVAAGFVSVAVGAAAGFSATTSFLVDGRSSSS
jgi:hypothetical protein